MVETFRTIEYSDPKKFVTADDQISLKEYEANLQFYASYDVLKDADVFQSTPTVVGGAASYLDNYDSYGGVSGKHLHLIDTLEYGENNFYNLINGAISFGFKPKFINGFSYHPFTQEIIAIQATADYYFEVFSDEVSLGEFTVSLDAGDDKSAVWAKLSASITSISDKVAVGLYPDTERLTFVGVLEGRIIEVKDVTAQLSLITAVGGLNDVRYINPPTVETTFFKLDDVSGANKNNIEIYENLNSEICAKLYDKDGVLVFDDILFEYNGHHNFFDNIEINWNNSLLAVFLNGELQKLHPFATGYERESVDTKLFISSDADNPYGFDNLLIFDEVRHLSNFELPTESLTIYPTDNPYIKINFGVVTAEELNQLMINSVGDLRFILETAGTPFYFFDNAWYPSDGTPTKSSDATQVETYIGTFPFVENADLLFTIFFASTGYTEAILEDINFDITVPNETEATIPDFSEIYNYVRSQLGAPRVPVELTDEQIQYALADALHEYKKWRYFKESIITTSLVGDHATGYTIPPEVGGEDNITDIFVSPRYPLYFYNGKNDVMSLIWTQQFFQTGSAISNSADFYMSLQAQEDLAIMLGANPVIEYLNGKIFINPPVTADNRVGIKYKSPLSISEINNEKQIRELTLAYSMQTLGRIRETFGDQIPGGDGMLSLNGSSLKSEGFQKQETVIAEMKSQSMLYEFDWG